MRAGCLLTLLVISLCASASGCRGNKDRLENELRSRDIQYREALEDLGRAEARSVAIERENELLRKGGVISPEQAVQTFGLNRIMFGRGTGGIDNDKIPGDEALQVILEPRDIADHIIKSPGTLHILAMEVSPQGVKTPFSTWTVDPDKLRVSWKQSLLSTGYNLILPWSQCPVFENLRIVARFVTPDGRVFETDKDIRVRLIAGIRRPPEVSPEFIPPPPTPSVPPTIVPMPGGGPTLGPVGPRGPAPGGPAPVPPMIDPYTLPVGHSTRRDDWQAAPLDRAVQLGPPQPLLP